MGRATVLLIAVVAVVASLITILFLAPPAAPSIYSSPSTAQPPTGGGASPIPSTAATPSAAQTSTAVTTTTGTPTAAPSSTTTKPPSTPNLVKLDVSKVIVDTLDPPSYADIVSSLPVYDLNYVNKLRQSDFVVVEITLINTLNRELALRPDSFILITDKGEYPSTAFNDPYTAFSLLRNAFRFNPLFSGSGFVYLESGYVLQRQYLTFMVPRGAAVRGLALVDGGVRLAEVSIDSNAVSYLSAIRSVRIFSNDTGVKVELYSATPLYTIDKATKIEVRIHAYDPVRTVALVGVDVVLNSTLKRLRGQLSKDLPVSIWGDMGTPVTISVELPAGGRTWDVNITFYFAYYPTWRIEVNSLINDTAEAVRGGHSGKTYLVYNVTAYFKGSGNNWSYLKGYNFRLLTSDGVYNTTDRCCPRASEKALLPWDIVSVNNGSSKQFQLVFLVPTSARPLYLLLVGRFGEVLQRIPVHDIKPTYYSVVDWVYIQDNSSDVWTYLYGSPGLYLLAGQRRNITIGIYVWRPEGNYSLVKVDAPPPFRLVAIYPNIIGKVLKQSTNIQLEIVGPEGSYYFHNITITLYFRRGAQSSK